MPKRAMVLAAGEGRRMRPLSDSLPKPLIEVQERAMIDRVLDKLAEAGVEEAVVNLHHLGQQVRDHLQGRQAPRILFSEEPELLETGGGVVKALPLLGDAPFFVVSSDIHWLDGTLSVFRRLADRWDPEEMDGLLLLHPTVTAFGYDGPGDFCMDPQGRVSYRPERELAPFVFAGIQLFKPEAFAGRKVERFPLVDTYQELAEAGRLYGLRHEGEWFQVGTPEDLRQTEAVLDFIGFYTNTR